MAASQAYTSKRRILIQVLPVPNAYTKSGDATKGVGKMNICMGRFGIPIGDRKYLNEYTPFGSVSLWTTLNFALTLYAFYTLT